MLPCSCGDKVTGVVSASARRPIHFGAVPFSGDSFDIRLYLGFDECVSHGFSVGMAFGVLDAEFAHESHRVLRAIQLGAFEIMVVDHTALIRHGRRIGQ